jgi:acetyl esterase/lipase
MRIASAILLVLAVSVCQAQERIRDVIYLKQGGCAFTMDVFKPKTPSHKAVIWLVSGGWVSDHNQISPDLAKLLTDKGFTCFEVVHGAQPRFKISEIIPQIRRAVRFVRANAATYDINPNEIGISGASAGGHLSLEVAGLGDDGNPNSSDPVEKASSKVNAVVAFFPPTDFLNWGGPGITPFHNAALSIFMPAFGVTAQTPEDRIHQIAVELSPVTNVSAAFPPTLLVHGDADKLVPVQQSQELDQLFTKDGVVHKLDISHGTGHDEQTLLYGLPDAISWFETHLTG